MKPRRVVPMRVGCDSVAAVRAAGVGGSEAMAFVRTEVDGVPTLWAESEAGLRAGLVFRVGCADETLPRGGITHLVEHLVLHPIDQTDYHFNGAMGPVTTTFFTEGDPDEIAQFLAAVCRVLRDLPMDRLPTERGMLRTEWSGRSRGITDPLGLWRYGAASYGLSSCAEFGLNDLTPDDLRAWVARWFTRGNAALWVAGGPPPPQLQLDLSDGPRMPAPAPSSALPRMPAFFASDVDGIAFDAVVRRSSAAAMFAALLDRRMYATLRRKRGASYAAWATYQPRDGEFGTVTACADALPDKRGEVTEAFVDVLTDVAAGAVGGDDLAAIRAQAEDALLRRDAAGALLPLAATDLLMGARIVTPRQGLDMMREVSTEDVCTVAQEALASGLLMVPLGQSVGRAGFVAAPAWSSSAVEGRSFKPYDHPVDRRRLLIGPDGVSLVDGRQVATVRYAECAGMLSWADGARSLYGSDAINIHLEPRLWRLPADALDPLDRAIPPERVAHMPDRQPESLPIPRTHRAQRIWARLRSCLMRPATVWVAIAVVLLVLIVVFPLSRTPGEVSRALRTGLAIGAATLVVTLLSRRK